MGLLCFIEVFSLDSKEEGYNVLNNVGGSALVLSEIFDPANFSAFLLDIFVNAIPLKNIIQSKFRDKSPNASRASARFFHWTQLTGSSVTLFNVQFYRQT